MQSEVVYLFRDFELPGHPRVGDELAYSRKLDSLRITRVEWLPNEEHGFVVSGGYGFQGPNVEFYAEPVSKSSLGANADGTLKVPAGWAERKLLTK